MLKNKGSEQGFTNNILQFIQGNKEIFFFPVYTRMKVKSIAKISYEDNTALLDVDIFITVRYEGISEYLQKQLLQEILKTGIRLSFNKNQNIVLKKENINVNEENNSQAGLLHFTVSKFIITILQHDVRFAPFEKVVCQTVITFNRIKIQHDQGKVTEIHFNLMDHKDIQKKISISSDSNFGLFEIGRGQFLTSFNQTHLYHDYGELQKKIRKYKKQSQKIKSEQEQSLPLTIFAAASFEHENENKMRLSKKQRPEAFNSAHLHILLFKSPIVGIVTIFIPLLLLAIINMGIFFQEQNLHKRIVSIGALMVSFVALIPVIREQIPPTPQITVIEGLVFVEAFTTVLALIESLIINFQDPQTYVFNFAQNGFFITSLILTILVNLTVLVMLVLHWCLWVKTYKYGKDGEFKHLENNILDEMTSSNIIVSEWMNLECDRQFLKHEELLKPEGKPIFATQQLIKRESILIKNLEVESFGEEISEIQLFGQRK